MQFRKHVFESSPAQVLCFKSHVSDWPFAPRAMHEHPCLGVVVDCRKATLGIGVSRREIWLEFVHFYFLARALSASCLIRLVSFSWPRMSGLATNGQSPSNNSGPKMRPVLSLYGCQTDLAALVALFGPVMSVIDIMCVRFRPTARAWRP